MKGDPIEHTSIQIVFENDQGYNEIRASRADRGLQNTIFSFRSAYRLHSQLNITELKSVNENRNNNEGATSSIGFDQRIIYNYQRLAVYLNSYRKTRDLTDKVAGEQVMGQLNSFLDQCLGLRIHDTGDIIDKKGTLFFKKADQATPFSFDALSSGEKEVVDILLDTFLKRDEFSDSIYIIDEPELHINTSIQKKLLIVLDEMISDNCQLWVATHSIGFLNALQNELRSKADIIEFQGALSTETYTLRPIKKNRENWQRILKTALEDLTGLIAPSTIIYCEGKRDPSATGGDQGLDAEVYNNIFDITKPESLLFLVEALIRAGQIR